MPSGARRSPRRAFTGDGLPGSHGQRLAMQLEHGELAVLHDVARGRVGGWADDDGARLRGGLEASRRVDGVTCHEASVGVEGSAAACTGHTDGQAT